MLWGPFASAPQGTDSLRRNRSCQNTTELPRPKHPSACRSLSQEEIRTSIYFDLRAMRSLVFDASTTVGNLTHRNHSGPIRMSKWHGPTCSNLISFPLDCIRTCP